MWNDTFNNDTVTYNYTHAGRSSAMVIIYGTILAIITILAIFGNVLVIITIARNRRLKENMSNLFIVNLAITDLLNGVMVMIPTFVALIEDEWLFGKLCCNLQCGFNYCYIIVSMLTLSAISIDRYEAVKHSLSYHVRVTQARIQLALCFTWIQGIAFAVVPVALHWVRYDYWEMVCAINWWYEEAITSILIYVVVAFLMCFTLPCIIIAHNYAVIIATARKAYQPHIDKQTKTIKSIMVVMLLFFICMTPFCVTKLVKVIAGTNDTIPGHINSISSLVQLLASSVNPFIYGIFRKDFQRGYASLFKCRNNPNRIKTLHVGPRMIDSSTMPHIENSKTVHHVQESHINELQEISCNIDREMLRYTCANLNDASRKINYPLSLI